MHWYQQTLRKVHILYVSPEWAIDHGRRFDADRVVARLREAGVDTIQLYGKDHHGYAYYRSRLSRPYPRDIFGELLEAAHRADMRFVGYFSVGLDAYALGMNPEWLAMDREGRPFHRRPFWRACLNSPYRDYALRQLEEMVSQYPVDGVWLDIIPLAYPIPDVYYGAMFPLPCYCVSCARRFRERTGRDIPLEPTLEQLRESYQFMMEGVSSFLSEAIALSKRYQPDAVCIYNLAGHPADPCDAADVTSIEGHAPLYLRQSLIARWGRMRPKPFEILTPGGLPTALSGWDNWDEKPAEVMAIEAAIGAVHGGSTVFGIAPYPDGSIDDGQFEAVRRAFAPVREIEPYCVGATPVSDVAVALLNRPDVAPERWLDVWEEAQFVHGALLDRHLQYDVVSNLDHLDRYQALVLPDTPVLSARQAAAVRAFVENGGHLLAIGGAGTVGEDGRPLDDFALADLLGLRYQGRAESRYCFLRLRPGALDAELLDVPLMLNHAPTRVVLAADDVEVLGDLQPPQTPRTDATTILWGNPPPEPARAWPGLTRRAVGRGSAWYVAVPLHAPGLGGVWGRRLIGGLVSRLVPCPLLTTDAPPGVEVVVNRTAGRHAVHFVNLLAGSAEHTSVGANGLTLRGLTLQIDAARLGTPTSVRALPEAEVRWRLADGKLHIDLPPIERLRTIVIE